MRRYFGFLPLLCLCAVVVPAYAAQWSPQDFPDPVKNVHQCGRGGKPSWICDPDHVLSDYSQNVVEGTIHEIAAAQDPYRSAHCPKSSSDAPGYQVERVCCSQVTWFTSPVSLFAMCTSGCSGTGGYNEAGNGTHSGRTGGGLCQVSAQLLGCRRRYLQQWFGFILVQR